MQVKYYAWFETKHEKTEFIKLLNSCRSEMEAFAKVMDKYPNLSISQVNGIVENFKNEINKK
jgi:hypothetical protein